MEDRAVRRRQYVLAAVCMALALPVMACGCSAGESVKKYDLTGQLKKLNEEVAALNTETSELVDTIGVLDEKEGQLVQSVRLLLLMSGKTDEQLATTSQLAAILGQGRRGVAGVLSLAQQVLVVEQGLKGDTAIELGMAASTLELVHGLLGNLRAFEELNNAINSKLDRALEIMGNM
jgi:hypothetical protein